MVALPNGVLRHLDGEHNTAVSHQHQLALHSLPHFNPAATGDTIGLKELTIRLSTSCKSNVQQP